MCRLLFTFQTTCNQWLQTQAAFPNYLQPQNPLQPAPSPVGEGRGEGTPRMAAIFPKLPNRPNTSLAACCPLSSSLPRGERTGWLLGLRIPQGKRVCSLLFLLFRRPFKRPIQAICILLFSKYNQNQSSATVQAAFPILATRAGFLPVHRLSAAKFRGSKNAAR